MSIFQDIKKDHMQSRLNAEKTRKEFLTTLVSEISMKGKNDGNREANDTDAKDVLTKWLKNAKEVVRLAPSPEAIAASTQEIAWLESYLGEQMDKETLRQHIAAIVASNGQGCNMGIVMKELKLHHDGKYDGKTASIIAKEVLE